VGEGGGGKGPLEGVGPENYTENYIKRSTEYRIQLQQNSCIKLPTFLFFFICHLDLMIFMDFAPSKSLNPSAIETSGTLTRIATGSYLYLIISIGNEGRV
jgi:hypothetical protein